MKTYTASYRFPAGFLWGTIPGGDFLTDKGNSSYIYKLREEHIKAVIVDVPRDKCEPLKGNYDEAFIESVRSLLAKIRGQNIEPVVILNTDRRPGWQNLHSRDMSDSSDEYNFMAHLTEVLIPYTNYICMISPEGSLFSRGALNDKLSVLNDITDRIHSLSETAKAGLIMPDSFSGTRKILKPFRFDFLRNVETDFIGIRADKRMIEKMREVFGTERRPVLFLSDDLQHTLPENRAELLADKLYDAWHFYQQGWPVIGFFSETDIETVSADAYLYEVSCKKNAFEISTDMDDLPEKWRDFLKD